MLILTLTVCLVAEPTKCKQVDLPQMIHEMPLPFEQMRYGQLAAMKWIEEHPGHFVTRYRLHKREPRA